MTLKIYTHTDAPTGKTVRASIPQSSMTTADFDKVEAEALKQELTGVKVWTEDSLFAGIAPRGKRPTS